MNILQVISKLDSSQPARDVIETTRSLTLKGHKVVVVSQKSNRVKEIDEAGARHYIMDIGPNIFLLPLFIFKLARIIIKENINIVHTRDPLSAFLSFMASRRTERMLVSTLYTERIKGFLARTQFWAKRVIVSSDTEARFFLQRRLVSRNKIRVIRPSVDAEKPALVKPHNLNSFFIVGVTLSLSSPEKTEKLVRTISILSRAIGRLKIFIIDTNPGPGKSDAERIRLLLRRHLLEDIVVILPKGETLAPMDLLLQIEERESAGAKFMLEAQARRVPVISTNAGWVQDYALVDKTVAVSDTADPKILADRIFRLYKDEKKRNMIADEAQKFVKNKFNIKEATQLQLDVYNNIPPAENILIIKMGALGDVILAIPSLKAIRERFKNAKIKLLVSIENRDAFINCPYLDDVIVCDFKKRDKGLKGILRVAGELRKEDFDIVIDFQNNKKSHILAILSCAPKRYGYDNGKFSSLLNRKIKDSGIPMSPVRHQEKILNLLGIYDIEEKLELWPSNEDEVWAEEFLKSHWIKQNTKPVAFNVGSSPRWATKLWPTEYFIETGNRLARELGLRVVLIGKEKEAPRIEGFLKNAKFKPINALGKTNLTKLAALLKKCSVLISSDSAPIHVAASIGTPFVALFGPTDPRRHLPPADNFVVLKKNFDCSPCYKTHCSKNYACMAAIKPNEVHEAVVKLLKI